MRIMLIDFMKENNYNIIMKNISRANRRHIRELLIKRIAKYWIAEGVNEGYFTVSHYVDNPRVCSCTRCKRQSNFYKKYLNRNNFMEVS
jgi:hypothetical protein